MKGKNIPISLLALVDAGYKTLHFVFPNFGSSEAKTLPIAEIDKWRKKRIQIIMCRQPSISAEGFLF